MWCSFCHPADVGLYDSLIVLAGSKCQRDELHAKNFGWIQVYAKSSSSSANTQTLQEQWDATKRANYLYEKDKYTVIHVQIITKFWSCCVGLGKNIIRWITFLSCTDDDLYTPQDNTVQYYSLSVPRSTSKCYTYSVARSNYMYLSEASQLRLLWPTDYKCDGIGII